MEAYAVERILADHQHAVIDLGGGHSVVAVTIALVWVLIVEGVLVSFTLALGRWLPAVPAAP